MSRLRLLNIAGIALAVCLLSVAGGRADEAADEAKPAEGAATPPAALTADPPAIAAIAAPAAPARPAAIPFSYATHAWGPYHNGDFVTNPVYTGSYNASVSTIPYSLPGPGPYMPAPLYSAPPAPMWGYPYYSSGRYDYWRWYRYGAGYGYGPYNASYRGYGP